MSDILKKIARTKHLPKSHRSFVKAIQGRGVSLIAEIKKASPSEGVIRKDFDVLKIARTYEENGAAAISVLTDREFFQGGFENLALAEGVTRKTPLLCKDFIVEEYQIYKAREFGADAILLIVGLLDVARLKSFQKIAAGLGMDCLVEVHSESELKKALAAGAKIIGINNRNLKTFKIDADLTNRLIKKIPKSKLVVAESGINSREDIEKLDARVDAVLIGTSLMKSKNIKAKLKELCDR